VVALHFVAGRPRLESHLQGNRLLYEKGERMIYWTELWVAVLTAGLAFALWYMRLVKTTHEERLDRLALGKADRRIRKPKPRARRVDTVFHDRDAEGREHWLCVKCGASVPKMGHTVKACEDFKFAEMRREQDAEQAAAEDAAKAAHAVATGGLELPDVSGAPTDAGVGENKIIDLKD
jgi:hypothetical protein